MLPLARGMTFFSLGLRRGEWIEMETETFKRLPKEFLRRGIK
jgi:hypothetical protein